MNGPQPPPSKKKKKMSTRSRNILVSPQITDESPTLEKVVTKKVHPLEVEKHMAVSFSRFVID